MKKEEVKYLESEKIRNGKSLELARAEVKHLIDSQKGFKELKREVQILERKLESKDKELDKLRKHNFSLLPRSESKVNEIKSSNNDEVTLKQLNRIMSILESENRIGLSDLQKTCVIKPNKLKGALNFLNRYNLIKQIPDGNKLMIEILKGGVK